MGTPASNPPTERRGEALPEDHPLRNVEIEPGDCISEVDPALLDEVVAYYGDDPPPPEPVPDDVELV